MKSEFLYVKGQSIRNKTHFVWGGKGSILSRNKLVSATFVRQRALCETNDVLIARQADKIIELD